MLINLNKNTQKINFTGLDGVAKKAVGKLHISPEELTALRQNYAEKEILFKQGGIGDCYLISVLKSTMFGLNEYANKTGQQGLNAKNWLKKLVVKDDKGNAEVFPPILKKLKVRLPVTKMNVTFFPGSQGNGRITFLECGYGILRKWTDELVKDKKWMSELLNAGRPHLAMLDITGLKGGEISVAKADFKNEKELKIAEKFFKEHTGKLFKKFQKHPENLILIASTKADVPAFLHPGHGYSVKKVVDSGLLLVDPLNKTNEKIFINNDDFYKYFESVNFARLRPEKMFKMIEETKKAVKDSPVLNLSVKPSFEPIRDSSKCYAKKDHIFVKDSYID